MLDCFKPKRMVKRSVGGKRALWVQPEGKCERDSWRTWSLVGKAKTEEEEAARAVRTAKSVVNFMANECA